MCRINLVSGDLQQSLTPSAPTQRHTFALQLMTGALTLWCRLSRVAKLMLLFSTQMTGFMRGPPRASPLEKSCTSRPFTRVQIQDRNESSSTTASPRCRLTQDQFQDTTLLKNTGESDDPTPSHQPADPVLFWVPSCLVDTKQGGFTSQFQPRQKDHSFRLKLDVFLFDGDSRNTVSYLE